MRAYSTTELFMLTRSELFALHAKIAAELPTLSDADREIALCNLRRIHYAITRSVPAPS